MDFLLPVAPYAVGRLGGDWRQHWREIRKSDPVEVLDDQTDPPTEPLSLADAKAHLRIDGTDDDSWLGRAIPACRRQVEMDLGWSLIDTTLEMVFDGFPIERWIELRGRVEAIVSLSSFDVNDVETVVASSNYLVDTWSTPGRIVLKTQQVWPNGLRALLGGKVRWTVSAMANPHRPVQAMCLLLSHWYEHREAVTSGIMRYTPDVFPLGYQALLSDRLYAMG